MVSSSKLSLVSDLNLIRYYHLQKESTSVYVLIYVDDTPITSNYSYEVEALIKSPSIELSIRLGLLR